MSDNKKQQLHISEVKPTDSITVTAMMDSKKIEISCTYAELTEEQTEFLNVNYGNHYLPVELITMEVNGEVVPVTFQEQNSVLQVVVVNPDGVFKFENILIRKTTLPGDRTFHLINAVSTLGIRFNRRRGVRVNVDTRMELEQGEEKFIILVREISYCGFSFINLSQKDVDPSRPFVLNLIERDGDKSFSYGKFIGKVHRTEEVKGGSTIYGCILAEKHADQLQKYVAMKQLELLTGKKAFAEDIQKTSNSDRWRAEVADALGDTLVDNGKEAISEDIN
ncbi:hypothetical protein [Pseudobutyrivibrio xylanivorans]|uniref:PilZ domain-containing protein n=1 Tax=Pseudobutyrivibrio xylanivorans DSM 14809 TaxID=1123012 RepID=A0A1M6EN94_PSEXY|nr:hypothetical protein [Pseudobutyrivibrio xylanivorans]SHI86931.1 hypothetical protein SAMN02745725_01274 [Pseudobutyrivibrio xylanivorans DSM 14809]